MLNPDFKAARFSTEACSLYDNWLRRGGRAAQKFEELCAANAALADDLRELHRIADLARAVTIQKPLREILGSAADFELTLDAEASTATPAAAQAAKDFQAPERYVIQGEVARGGMGVIYKIRDRELNRTLAMKVMLPEASRETQGASRGSRFVEEVQLTAQLDHPGIVAVHELGADPSGRPYFTMKLVKGRDLASIFELAREEKEGWSLPRAVGALIKACQAVAFAHSKGVIHRDLKPANVMVGRFGEVYVMDWGLAKVLGRPDRHDICPATDAASLSEIKTPRTHVAADSADSPLITMDGSVVGTPAYMPPEQAKGQVEDVDALSDVYSLGAMLYALLTGRGPYTEPDARISPYTILGMVMQGPPKGITAINPKAPAELVAICEKAMAREKRDRYQSSLDLAEDLQAWIDHRVVKAYRTGAAAEFKSWVIRNPLTATATAAAAVLLVAGFFVVSVKNRQLHAKEQESNRFARSVVVQRNEARSNLFNALIREARATRLARLPGYRPEVFKLLNQARALGSPDKGLIDVRNEAVLTLGDFIGHPPLILTNFGASRMLTLARLTDDGRAAALAFSDGTLEFRDLPSGQIAQVLKLEQSARAIVFTSDGSRMFTLNGGLSDASGVVQNDATIAEWKRSGDGNWRLGENRPAPVVVDLARIESGAVMIAWNDNSLALRDVSTGKELHRFLSDRAQRELKLSRVSPNGRFLLAAFGTPRDAGILTVWDAVTGFTTNLACHVPHLLGQAFTGDSENVLVPTDRGVVIYDLPSWKLAAEIPAHLAGVVGFSATGDLVTLANAQNGRLQLWDWKRRTEFAAYEPVPLDSSFSSDGRWIALRGTQQLQVYRLDSVDERLLLAGHAGGTPGFTFSADSRRIVSTGKDRTLRMCDTSSGAMVWMAGPLPGPGQSVAYSPDETLLATSSFATSLISIWNASDGRELARLGPNVPANTWSVRFSPDGQFLAAAGERSSVRIWKIRSSNSTNRTPDFDLIAEKPGSYLNIHFLSNREKVIYSTGRGFQVEVWDFKTTSDAITVESPMYFGVWQSFALMNDATRCIVNDGQGTLRVLETETFREVSTVSIDASGVQNIAISPDGSLLALVSRSRAAAELWDFSGRFLYRLPEMRGPIWWLGWSPDGKRLATSGASGEIAIWNIPGIERALADAGLND